VPRPQVLESGRVVTVYLESKVYEALRRIALSKGKNVSALVREVLAEYLERAGVNSNSSEIEVLDDPPNSLVDPVVQMDIEDLAEEVSEVERSVISVENALSKSATLPRSQLEFWFKHNRDKLLDRLVKAENSLRKLRYKYYRLKRSTKNSGEVGQLAVRMYALKNKIRELRKKLG
jgi:hypothetical protein